VKAVALLAFAFGVVIAGDGGVRQRPVYVDAGECLARGVDGKLFATDAGGPWSCVAFDRRPLPEIPPKPERPVRCVPLSADGFCGVIDLRCSSAANAPLF
jgi:hypothetical protein